MSQILDALGPDAFKQQVSRFRRSDQQARRERADLSKVLANPYELGYAAWTNAGIRMTSLLHHGAWLWHGRQSVNTIRTAYSDAARDWSELANGLDFSRPLLMYDYLGKGLSAKERDEAVEIWKEMHDEPVERVTRDRRLGALVWFPRRMIREHQMLDAPGALLCACIGRDWETAERLAATTPTKLLKPESDRGDANYLLRCCVLGKDKQAVAYGSAMSARGQGVDFPPQRPDLALAVISGDEKPLIKAVKASLKTFSDKWKIEKYMTSAWLKRHGNNRDSLRAAVIRDLLAYRWLYSPWTIALCAIAERRGMDLSPHAAVFNEFAPGSLCTAG